MVIDAATLASVTGAGPQATVIADDNSTAVSRQDQVIEYKNKYALGQHLLGSFGKRDRNGAQLALYAFGGLYNSQKAINLANNLPF
jgi:hypothetical protein